MLFKILFRGRFYSKNALAHFSYIQVHFENTLFAPKFFNHKSKIHFQAFSKIATVLPKENIFCHLLAYSTGAPQRFTFLIMLHSLLNAFKIKTIMVRK